MKTALPFVIVLLALLASAAPAAERPAAATVLLVTGEASASDPATMAVRPLQKDDAVFSGEVVSAGPNTYVNLRFSDDSYVLLRPNSRFAIERYAFAGAPGTTLPAATPQAPDSAQGPAATVAAAGAADWRVIVESYVDAADAEGVAARLRKRGLTAEVAAVEVRKGVVWHRVLIGALADRAAAEAVVADLKRRGFRAPDIVAGTAAAPAAVAAAPQPPPAATASTAPTPAPTSAPTATATPALPAETPVAAAAPQPAQQQAVFRLLKGGFRAVSGLIGKTDPEEYRVSTPVATIGIRGTDYWVILCDAACASDPALAGSLPEGTSGLSGVLVGVISGGVFSLNADGERADVQADQYLITLPDGSQVFLPFEPRFIKLNPIPDPTTMCEP